MAGFMKIPSLVLLLVMVWATSSWAQAQTRLSDPTKPALAPVLAGTAVEEGERSLRLETVLISPQRKMAIISGQTFQLGQTIAGVKLIAVSEAGVTLEQGGQRRSLALYPEVRKQLGATKLQLNKTPLAKGK